MKPVELHVNSEFSLLRSALRLESFCARMESEGRAFVALTDVNNAAGFIKFDRAARAHHLCPLFGLELTVTEEGGVDSTLLLYAKNEEGYRLILKIASEAMMKHGLSRAALSCLVNAGNASALAAVLPGLESDIGKAFYAQDHAAFNAALSSWRALFPDLTLGLSRQEPLEEEVFFPLWEEAKALGLATIALHKVAYLTPADQEAYAFVRALAQGSYPYEGSAKEENESLLSVEGWEREFTGSLSLIENAETFAKRLSVTITYGTYHFPRLFTTPGQGNDYLTDLAKLGLNKRLKGKTLDERKVAAYRERLLYELKVITSMGFADYFLIVQDYVCFAKKHGILVGPGRGSAPSSLVSYALGITDIDPLVYGLLFERFLNPERLSMPDIDIDFPDDRREEIIHYLIDKYGAKRVAHIAAYGTFGLKSTIRDCARLKGIDEATLKEVLRLVPDDRTSHPLETFLADPSLARLAEAYPDVAFIVRMVTALHDLPRTISTHAAGIVMADQDLDCYTPLETGLGDTLQTQFEATDLEAIGLVKMDLLGLANLTMIDQVTTDVRKDHPSFRLEDVRLDDKATYALIARGDTAGLFQLESAGMRRLLSQMKVSCFQDIVAANALYRPGPMEMIPTYIARKNGTEPVTYPHPDLEPILKETYGVIVYQEQIMQIACTFAGFTLGEADVLRRAVAKKKQALLEKEKAHFITGARAKGYSLEVANRIYDYFLRFANYGFNKSHSVSYALIAYRMAYLKTHAFPYFAAVIMTNQASASGKFASYVQDARRHRVRVLPPDINLSTERFVVASGAIITSLLAVRECGLATVQALLKERTENGPFKDYPDFLSRTRSFLSSRLVGYLIDAGALDGFGAPRKSLAASYDETLSRSSLAHLFNATDLVAPTYGQEEYTFAEITSREHEALGVNLKYDVFQQYEDEKTRHATVAVADLGGVTGEVNVLVKIASLRTIKTKKGESMAFADGYDPTGTVSLVLFPQAYSSCRARIAEGSVIVANGHLETRDDKLSFIVRGIYFQG